MDQVIQICGSLLVVSAFVASQAGRLRIDGLTYLLLNFVGSAILAVLAYVEQQWGFLLLEAVWAVVSLWSLVQRMRGVTPTAPGH